MDAFQTISDILSTTDSLQPAVSHPSTFPEWREVAEQVMEDTITSGEVAITRKEEARLEQAKEVGFSFLEKFLGTALSPVWSSQEPAERRAAVLRLLERPQIPQRTPEWYDQGKRVLTASEFSSLYASARTRGQLIMTKAAAAVAAAATPITSAQPMTQRLACLTCEMGPFDWGIRFEPVVKQVLEKRWGAKIMESGRVVHPRDPRLAASPDGLVLEAADPARIGRLIEIKCPISRTVQPGVIPFEYWCQMQIQMEVCGIGECEYVEVKIKSIQKNDTELPAGEEAEGHVWLLQNPSTAEMSYAYTEEELQQAELAGCDVIETIPWRVGAFWSKTVARDQAWFHGTEELRAAFWRDVEAAKTGAYTLPESTRQRRAPGTTSSAEKVVIVHKEGAAPPAACMFLDEEEAVATTTAE